MAAPFKCPLCGSIVSKVKYDRVMKIDAAKAEQLHEAHERETELTGQLRLAKKGIRDARAVGEHKGREFEKKRSARLVQGLEKKLTLANERVRQLQKGSTPQTEGIEFEKTLVARLRREFPDDDIKHEGKGGDVLHTVLLKGKPGGLILYECKRYLKINRAHVEQAARDKRGRQADFAILVTTGTRSGFSGLARDGDVLIAAPLAVIPLVHVLRAQLVEIARARVSREERERIALAMLDYLASPAFAGPVEEAVAKTRRAQEMLKREAKDHFRVWQERWDIYQTIDLDLANVTSNIIRVREGSQPLPLAKVKPSPLQLPAMTTPASIVE